MAKQASIVMDPTTRQLCALDLELRKRDFQVKSYVLDPESAVGEIPKNRNPGQVVIVEPIISSIVPGSRYSPFNAPTDLGLGSGLLFIKDLLERDPSLSSRVFIYAELAKEGPTYPRMLEFAARFSPQIPILCVNHHTKPEDLARFIDSRYQ